MHAGERFKSGLKRAARGAMSGPARSREGCCVILTYHSVGARDHEMNVTPAAFREQMAWLAGNARVLPLAEAIAGSAGVAITFDDGYRDNFTAAAPVLAEFGLSATLFAVAGRMGGWLDHDVKCAESQTMSWDELRALSEAGWTIGGHTMTHPRLSRLNEAEQRREIVECKAAIEGEIRRAVDCFAYPFGSALDFSAASRAIVREAGYAIAVSNCYGVNGPGADRWALRRIWIDRSDTLESFRAKVEGRLDRLAWLDSGVGIRARWLMNRVLRAG